MHSRFHYKCAYEKIINCSACCAACYVNLDLKKKNLPRCRLWLCELSLCWNLKGVAEQWPKAESWWKVTVKDSDWYWSSAQENASYTRICWTVWSRTTNELPMAHGDPMHMALFWIGILFCYVYQIALKYWIELLHCPHFMLRRVMNFLD